MAANTPRSRKSKGREFQKDVRTVILEKFSMLEPDDVKVAIMSEPGEDIKLSPRARQLIPYSFECKRQEKMNVWDSIQQAEKNAPPSATPVVVFRRNNSEAYAVVKLQHFVDLISEKHNGIWSTIQQTQENINTEGV